MRFNNLRDFILHNYSSQIPVDVKIGDDFATIKVSRGGSIYIKKYVSEKEYDIDISGFEENQEREIEKHMAGIIGKDMEVRNSMVAIVNKKMCTIRKINNYTTIIFTIKSRYDFESEEQMEAAIKEAKKQIDNK